MLTVARKSRHDRAANAFCIRPLTLQALPFHNPQSDLLTPSIPSHTTCFHPLSIPSYEPFPTLSTAPTPQPHSAKTIEFPKRKAPWRTSWTMFIDDDAAADMFAAETFAVEEGHFEVEVFVLVFV